MSAEQSAERTFAFQPWGFTPWDGPRDTMIGPDLLTRVGPRPCNRAGGARVSQPDRHPGDAAGGTARALSRAPLDARQSAARSPANEPPDTLAPSGRPLFRG